MNYDNADENFVTKDIYIASSLVALGYKLGFLTKKGSIFYFNFIPRNKDDEGFFSWAESTYWDDGLKVSPK